MRNRLLTAVVVVAMSVLSLAAFAPAASADGSCGIVASIRFDYGYLPKAVMDGSCTDAHFVDISLDLYRRLPGGTWEVVRYDNFSDFGRDFHYTVRRDNDCGPSSEWKARAEYTYMRDADGTGHTQQNYLDWSGVKDCP